MTKFMVTNPSSKRATKVNRRLLMKWLGLGGSGLLMALSCRSRPSQSGRNSYQKIMLDQNTITVGDRGDIRSSYPITVNGFTEDLGNGISFTMVQIPVGTFIMGQTEAEKQELIRLIGEQDYQDWHTLELPAHEVAVPSFFMGMMTVTQAVYEAVMGINPTIDAEGPGVSSQNKHLFIGSNNPVAGISWHDAIAFCEALGQRTGRDYRLPSEAEWEYACRAGTTTPFYFGPTLTDQIANYYAGEIYGDGPKGDPYEHTTPVGRFPPNAFGLYDMHGNVFEWCSDHWHDNYNNAPDDGSPWIVGGDSSRRVIRGGSWYNVPGACRSATRVEALTDKKLLTMGLRLVCSSAKTT